jgi:hypothetical protein
MHQMADHLEVNRKINPPSRSKKHQTRLHTKKKRTKKQPRKRRRSSAGAQQDNRRVLPRLSLHSNTAVESAHITSVASSNRASDGTVSVSPFFSYILLPHETLIVDGVQPQSKAVALLFYTEVSSPPTGVRILAHGDKCYRSNHVNKDGEHTYHVITRSSKHNYARKLYYMAKVSLLLIVCSLALVYQLKNHVPVMYELYLALKANQARRQPPTTLEIDLASGRRNASDVTAVAYFQKLAADQEALAQARKVCSPFCLC